MDKPRRTVDWQDGKSRLECTMYMLEKEIMCDVTFRVGTEQSIIKAHKNRLASRSPVFFTMFEGSCPEKRDVIVPDISVATFNIMLKYIYSDVLDLSFDNILEVLYVAEKYMLSTMKDECNNLLLSSVETLNAPEVFNVASFFHLEDLKNKSLEHIKKNAAECLLAPNAVKISKECLETILKLNPIHCYETDLCRFLIKWASHQCEIDSKTVSGENMRKITGSMLNLINFHLVDKEYFEDEIYVACSGLLSEDEEVSVFEFHNGGKNIFFTESVRKEFYKKGYSVLRHSSVGDTWFLYMSAEYDALKVSVNKKIELKAVILYGPLHGLRTTIHDITVKILNDCGNEIHNKKYEGCTLSCEMQTVLLSSPIPFNANKHFTIIVDSSNYTAHHGKLCKPEYRIDDIIVTFQKSLHCTTDTNENEGQIAGIEFNA
ncbi:BTBD3_6 [Mytilus coruscus]|uniref:BTBD3_6 n=1 Tax=Mytilus coruscus TaxID=42192 RepID=A0A6J8CEH4_MYTCO|nr:BTBD3_6 [Mytilus coruscus]